MQTWRGVVPLLPGALDKNQCGSFLPATAAPHRCSADESTPTRERLRAPGAAVRGRRAGAERGTDSPPGTDGDGAAPLFKASTGHWQPTFSPPASVAVCFSPLAVLGAMCAGRGERRRSGRRRARLAVPTRRDAALSPGDAFTSSPWQGGCHSPSVERGRVMSAATAVPSRREPSCGC